MPTFLQYKKQVLKSFYSLRSVYGLSPFLVSCRRLEPSECPLQMVYDYLAALGYADPVRVQQEAANSDLSCLIRFYSGECSASLAITPSLHRPLLLGVIWPESSENRPEGLKTGCRRFPNIIILFLSVFIWCWCV